MKGIFFSFVSEGEETKTNKQKERKRILDVKSVDLFF